MIPRSRAVRPFTEVPEQIAKIAEARVNGGMITSIDPADIPNGTFQLAKNAIIRFDKTQRRPGSYLLQPTKPNSLPVTKIAFIKTKDGSPYTLRFTPSTIHIRGASGWTAITSTSPISGGINDRFQTADILDKFVFTNNGVNPIQAIDFAAGSYGALGDAPNYRYVVGFFNRAVGLARRDEAENEVGWSADGDATIWNPLTNNSAGSSPILESPSDLSDFITGGLSFSNVMVVMREKSIWLATKQPIPQNPFYFTTAVPGIGMDCSYSLQLINNGLAWVDTKTKDVWAYTPGGSPERLSEAIKKDLFKQINNSPDGPIGVFSSFATIPSEYTIYIPSSDNITKAWTYNFEYKVWTYNEFYGVLSAANVDIVTSLITIDDLVGAIDDLPGTIDELSPSTVSAVPFSYGRDDGTIAIEDEPSDKDAPHTLFPSGIEFNTELESKTFVLPENYMKVFKLNIEYVASRTTNLSLLYSKDDGKSWLHLKTLAITKFNKQTLLAVKRQILARRFIWKLVYNGSDVAITNFELFATPSGDTQTGA